MRSGLPNKTERGISEAAAGMRVHDSQVVQNKNGAQHVCLGVWPIP